MNRSSLGDDDIDFPDYENNSELNPGSDDPGRWNEEGQQLIELCASNGGLDLDGDWDTAAQDAITHILHAVAQKHGMVEAQKLAGCALRMWALECDTELDEHYLVTPLYRQNG